jgi:hypothetical protein
MLTSTSGMNLTITLTPSEALALRDALALSGRQPDYNFTLDPLWSEIGDYIYNLCQRGVLPGDVF